MLRNNDFKFEGEITSSLRCPFAAHVRKTNPRDDLEVPPSPRKPISVQPRRIMRRGIQFGPELTQAENNSGKTIHDRGLLFQCYQTSIVNGFQFLQQSESYLFDFPSLILIRIYLAWADNSNFPPFTSSPEPPGYVVKFCLTIYFIHVHNNDYLNSLDPLIGQGTRSMIGLDPIEPLKSTSMGVFITPKGGEYFFSPSIAGLSIIANV